MNQHIFLFFLSKGGKGIFFSEFCKFLYYFSYFSKKKFLYFSKNEEWPKVFLSKLSEVD